MKNLRIQIWIRNIGTPTSEVFDSVEKASIYLLQNGLIYSEAIDILAEVCHWSAWQRNNGKLFEPQCTSEAIESGDYVYKMTVAGANEEKITDEISQASLKDALYWKLTDEKYTHCLDILDISAHHFNAENLVGLLEKKYENLLAKHEAKQELEMLKTVAPKRMLND